MNPQNNFFQNILPFLLIANLVVAAFLIYKKNPEIMSPEPYYKILQKQGELSASLIFYEPLRQNIFNTGSQSEISSSTHRYSEMKPEQFTPVSINSRQFEWIISGQNIVVVEKNKLTITATDGTPIRGFSPPKSTEFSPGPPCLYGEVLYLTTLNGRIYAIDTQTGDLLWYYHSALRFLRSPIMNQDQLVVFFAEKENPTWRYQTINSRTGELIFHSENIEQPLVGNPITKNNTLYFASVGGRLKAVNLSNGKTNWVIDDSSNFIGQLTLTGERLYISDESGQLLSYSASDGQRTNEIMLQNVLVGPILHFEDSNLVIGTTSDHSIIGIDLKGDKALWRQPLNLQKEDLAHLKLVKLNTQSLNLLSFNSKARGWTVWGPCRTTNICIFDVKSGLLLLRLDLKGLPVGKFELLPNTGDAPARLLAPLLRGDRIQIVGFANPASAPPNTKPSTLTK